jgi:hypothetical protein
MTVAVCEGMFGSFVPGGVRVWFCGFVKKGKGKNGQKLPGKLTRVVRVGI